MDFSRATVFRNVEQTVRHAILLALVYLIPTAQAMLPVNDPDVWWHLRTGQWIAQQGAVPHIDHFSSFGLGQHWVAYSWLFEILIYRLFEYLGLIGLVLFQVVLGIAVAAAIHLLIVRRARLSFAAEIVLTATALVCLKPLMTPRPWLFSILFFTLELAIILRFRESKNQRVLWWLPLLFLVWANIHIQFIYGLAALALFAFEPALQVLLARRLPVQTKAPEATLPLATALLLVCTNLAATLINPYHVYVYKPLFEVIRDTQAFNLISELQALSFRYFDNWFVLAFLVSVTFWLGWRHEQRLFPLGLMIMGLYLSFRARRDVWVGALACLAVIADWPRWRARHEPLSRGSAAVAAVFVVLGMVYLAHTRQINEDELSKQLAKTFPVEAARFIETTQASQAIFNHYDWGGFLLWSLPRFPVTMDGRSNLHGENRVAQNIDTWMGRPGWNKDRALAQATLVIGPVDLPLVALLRTDDRFRICYEDKIAAVFVSARQTADRCQKP